MANDSTRIIDTFRYNKILNFFQSGKIGKEFFFITFNLFVGIGDKHNLQVLEFSDYIWH